MWIMYDCLLMKELPLSACVGEPGIVQPMNLNMAFNRLSLGTGTGTGTGT